MHKALYILNNSAFPLIYGPSEQEEIAKLVDVIGPHHTAESILDHPDLLNKVEVILSGWGAPRLTRDFLDSAPNLKALFYGSGSVRSFVTDDFWERDMVLSNAYAANAVPVSEYTLGAILLSLKLAWRFGLAARGIGAPPPRDRVPGAYGSAVGLISLGMIGRLVLERLRPFDIKALVYDPFLSDEEAVELGIERIGLDELFERADVISLHTPLLDETRKMIGRRHFERMRPWSTFINTARGAIVDEPGMIEVLRKRPDIQALLDVTDPEPPEPGSPLYSLPNVIVTPHIAGSMNGECHRMGRYMIDELRRFIHGKPLRWQLTREKAAFLA